MILKNIPSFEALVDQLTKLPGVGRKTATRLAYHLLKTDKAHIEELRAVLKEAKENIKKCPECFSYTQEKGQCLLCQDSERSYQTLCVVEDPFDILAIEKSHSFSGQYHVLHGAISPLENIQPQDLTIKSLVERVERHKVKELILALDADLEGDTTVLYLCDLLKNHELKVTRIAHGVPIGGDIDYIDHRTLGRALENRIEV